MSSASEIANVGTGYTNFATFNRSGLLIFTYVSSGFGVWDTSGKEFCVAPDLGNGTMALSSDNRWLAGGAVGRGNSVMIWNMQNALSACGISSMESTAPTASRTDNSLIAQGRSRYLAYKCDECHGANGEGGDEAPDLTTTRLNADEISKFIEKPSPDAYMKGMPNIPATHPDNQALVAYVLSLKRPPAPQ